MTFERRAGRIVLSVGVSATVLFIGLIVARVARIGAGDVETASLASDISFFGAFFLFTPVGAFIALRLPRNPIGWLCLAIGTIQVTTGAAAEVAVLSLTHGSGDSFVGHLAAWISGFLWAPGIATMVPLILRFPTGTVLGPMWRWVERLALAAAGVIVVLALQLYRFPTRTLVESDEWIGSFEALANLAVFVMFGGAIAALASLVARFRRSTGRERQQLKLLAFMAACTAALLALETFLVPALGEAAAGVAGWSELALNLSAAAFPIAIAVAILRHRLYDIDVIINRALVYGALTAALLGCYLGIVVALSRLLGPVTQDSDIAIAASTLAVAALFRPLRTRIQGFIDRRFYRAKYDAASALERFGARLRDEVDIEVVRTDVLDVVTDTMQPRSASLWLRHEGAEAR